ncbi:MAG: sialidase family protein [Verrucomicrobia bacterium]|nr:sialidase family protein [Verrucomicrobiota bacterium]
MALALAWLTLAMGCGKDKSIQDLGEQTAFRVRSEFTAALNSEKGWAGALNENVSIQADQPFRVRFEVESAPRNSPSQFRLQYRRNAGNWTGVEAHDFPHPLRELDLDFEQMPVGEPPEGWTVEHGNPTGLKVALAGETKVLRGQAEKEPLIGIHVPRWEVTELAAEFRLSSDSTSGVGLVFGYVDAGNHYRLLLDAASGSIRLIRYMNGKETLMAEQKADIPLDRWLTVEIDLENQKAEVNFENDSVEFTVELTANLDSSKLGYYLPANSTAEFREFAIAGEARTPRLSIVSSKTFENGEATTDLLENSNAAFQAGEGVSMAESTGSWPGGGAQGEFEWALVVRRFADDAVTNEEGDTFELRMVTADGKALYPSRNPVLRLSIPPGHLGGTFVETPGRIGPWQASNGDLYFIMEPTETDNLFMMVKSADNGITWREVDGANRPSTNDLEAVDVRKAGDTLHIIHQVTRSVRHHVFRTSDHPTQPDTWAFTDELAALADSMAQAATLVIRSDGSMIAFYVGQTLHYNIRSADGTWGEQVIIDPDAPAAAGPQTVLGANDTVHLAYYRTDGTLWYRRLLSGGTLTDGQQLASGAGATRAEYGAVLPLIYQPGADTLVIIYRLTDGYLWERRVVKGGRPTQPVRVSDRKVVTDAVDSQQPGADFVTDGGVLHVFFIDEDSRSIFATRGDAGGWQPAKLQVGNILGSWVRGNVYVRPDGVKVYGFVYDAGSDGGAGLNRFAEVELDDE